MRDISGKTITIRTAKAKGKIFLGKEAFAEVELGSNVKGNVLETARIASVQAVKATSSIIPYCHPILIDSVDVGFDLNNESMTVAVTVTVKSTGKTGVEMEALTGVGAACLTIYDMLKYTGKAMIIEKIGLVEKTGGKS